MSSELNHWYLDATVYNDRVEEVYYISDPARNIRRSRQTRVWKVEQFLGQGSFGQVRLERNHEDGQVRAVKRITTGSATLSNSECEKELKALLEFSKPKFKEAAVFVEFFGWFKDGYDIFLAMEYVHLGDLHKNVVANSGKIPENEARDIAEQILLGLEIMHAEFFAHRDLKPQNILVIHRPPRWWVKLADFGLSKRLTNTTGFHTRAGTQSYMAPEILGFLNPSQPGSDYTNAVDIWSAGCIVYRLITGVIPFPQITSLMKYCEDKSLFPFDTLFDSEIKSEGSKFLRQLLVTKPSERPSATQALNHNWILSGSSIERMPPMRMSSGPLLEERSGLSNPTSSETGFNTASHAGLQSDPPLPSSSLQTVLLPPLASKISPPSNDTTTGPYPIRSAPTHAQASLFGKPRTKFVNKQVVGARGTLEGHTNSVNTIMFSPDGKLVASGSDNETVQLWDSAAGEARCMLEGHTGWVYSVAFSPDGKLVASGSYDRTVRLWDSATGAARGMLKGHTGWVYSVAFSPDGKLVASGSDDVTVRLWDSATGAARGTLEGHTGRVYSVAFSPDGKLVASGSDDEAVRLWDSATGAARGTLEGHTGGVYSVAFSPDGKLVASGSYDGTVRLWDSATGKAHGTLEGHTGRVNSVAFSPDGKLVASGSYDRTVRLWDSATGAACSTLEGHTGRVYSVAFSPDGKLVASGSDDETVRLWEQK